MKDLLHSDELRERVIKAEKMYIGYPRFEGLLEKVRFCHEYSSLTAEPECLLVKGKTGAGKSTLMKEYMKDHPRELQPTGTKVPILWGNIQVPATIKSLVQHLLIQINDPCAFRGSAVTQTERLKSFLRDCQVELIVLDEFQHFMDRDSKRINNTVSDWLKNIIEETRIPVVLLGLPECEQVLDSNPQLSRRFAHRYELAPFKFKTKAEIEEFRTFLYALDIQLPLSERSNLADLEMAFRFFYASDGVVGYIMKLVRKATYNALISGRDSLDLDVLSEAFKLHVQKDKPKKANPFDFPTFDRKIAAELSKKENEKPSPQATNRRMNRKKPPKEKLPF